MAQTARPKEAANCFTTTAAFLYEIEELKIAYGKASALMVNFFYMDIKARFFKVYASLPLGAWKEIVLTLDREGPITWEVAYIEVENDTQLAMKILEKLNVLGII